jgi:hypothetical protein
MPAGSEGGRDLLIVVVFFFLVIVIPARVGAT